MSQTDKIDNLHKLRLVLYYFNTTINQLKAQKDTQEQDLTKLTVSLHAMEAQVTSLTQAINHLTQTNRHLQREIKDLQRNYSPPSPTSSPEPVNPRTHTSYVFNRRQPVNPIIVLQPTNQQPSFTIQGTPSPAADVPISEDFTDTLFPEL